MADAISHIVDKIKTRNTTYVLDFFVDFSGDFRPHVLAKTLLPLEGPPNTPHVYNLLRSYFEDQEVQIRTPECIARKSTVDVRKIPYWDSYCGTHI